MSYPYDEVTVEAAVCLWEAFLECERQDLPKPIAQILHDLGTVEVRHAVMALAPACDAAWKALTPEEQEANSPYDWEWCPHFLFELCEWRHPVLNIAEIVTYTPKPAA